MDDLTAALEGSFQVSSSVNSTHAPHPRFSQYKAKSGSSSQDSRRLQVLKLQKQRRIDATNLVRRLVENCWDDDDDEDAYEEEEAEEYTKESTADDMEVEYLRRPGKNYRDQLMLSEWMLEVPASFATDWTMILCPAGKRNLVIASRGQTRSYSRSGWLINTFPSSLPGGSRSQSHWRNESTILDCIYSDVTRTYYVLDMMCWKGQPIYDSESEFRFYWLKTKFQETPEVSQQSKLNPYKFEALLNHDCNKETIAGALSADFEFELDGLLFYHKHAAYTFGTTPLVVWLKAYMLPEILHVSVPDKFIAPSSYVDFTTHAVQVRQEAEVRDQKKQNREKSCTTEATMDSSDSVVS